MEITDLFKASIIVMIFFSVSVNGINYYLPADVRDGLDPYTDVASHMNVTGIDQQLQASLQKQTKIPIVELGAMIFYSGNIFIDLLMNFAFAIPEMLSILVYGILQILNVETELVKMIVTFSQISLTAIYVISLIQMVVGIRSQKAI